MPSKPLRANKMKTCAKCGENLPKSEFYANKSAKDGLQSYCKKCQKTVAGAAHKIRNGGQSRVVNQENNPLASYQPRELIAELRRRGYEGELQILQKVKV